MENTPRIHAPEKDIVPRMMIRAMLALIGLCLILVAGHVWTGQPKQAAPSASPIIAEKAIFFKGDLSGSVIVLDGNGTLIADLAPDKGGFISGVWRVVNRERLRTGVDPSAPVLVQAFENGRMAITDPATGWSADLMGFGQDNLAAFAKLLQP